MCPRSQLVVTPASMHVAASLSGCGRQFEWLRQAGQACALWTHWMASFLLAGSSTSRRNNSLTASRLLMRDNKEM